MKIYKIFDKYLKKEFSNIYSLNGLKSALSYRHSWIKKLYDVQVIEYEAKEVRRLTVDEFKQLSNKVNTNKYLELLDLVVTKPGLTIEFYDCNTGSVWIDNGAYNIEFNSLDKAIEIVNKY